MLLFAGALGLGWWFVRAAVAVWCGRCHCGLHMLQYHQQEGAVVQGDESRLPDRSPRLTYAQGLELLR